MEYQSAVDIEKVLETYTLEEILEINELTDEEVLTYLVKTEFVALPEFLPL